MSFGYRVSATCPFVAAETFVRRSQASRMFPPDMQDRALRKLRLLDAAAALDDLSKPASNRLKPLKGDRKGQWSMRVNDQWRICFRWNDGDAGSVEIVDYH